MAKKTLYYYLVFETFSTLIASTSSCTAILTRGWTWGNTLTVLQLFKIWLDKATVDQTWCCWQSCFEGVVGQDDFQRSLLTVVHQGGQQPKDQEWRVPEAILPPYHTQVWILK